MSLYPAFAGAIPRASYVLVIEDLDASSTVNVTVDLSGDDFYAIPPDTVPTTGDGAQASDFSDTRSVYKAVLDALDTDVTNGSVWRFQFESSRDRGWGVGLTNDNGIEFRLLGASGSNTFDLEWIGYPNATTSSSSAVAASTIQPKYTWFPWSPLNDYHGRVYGVQVYSSGPTEDGSVYTVRQSDGTLRRWRWFAVDGSFDAGVDGARISIQKQDGRRAEWRNQADVGESSTDPYIALDASDGWWHRTVDGTPWVLIPDMLDGSEAEELVFTYATELAPPADMSGWPNLAPPTVIKTSAGRSVIEVCAIPYVDPGA